MECYYRLICLWICFPFFIIYFLKSSSNFSSNFWWLDLIEIGCCISLFSDELKDNWKRKFQWTIFFISFSPFSASENIRCEIWKCIFIVCFLYIYIYMLKKSNRWLFIQRIYVLFLLSIDVIFYFISLKKNDKKWIKMISLSVGYIYLGVPHQVDWIWTHFGLVVIFSTHYKLTSKSCSITDF